MADPHREPKVTVCIPTYNRGKLLRETIDSVLAQTWTDLELILVDDGSKDDTRIVAESIQDSRFTYVRNAETLGMAQNWNRCLDLARGELVAILHDDDRWLPEFLETLIPLFDADPTLGMALSAARIIDADGAPQHEYRPWPRDRDFAAGDLFFEILAANRILCPTVLLHRQAVDATGRFDPAVTYATDWHMWLRLSAQFPVAYRGRVLAEYRKGHGSLTDQLGSFAAAHRLHGEARYIIDSATEHALAVKLRGTSRAAARAKAHHWCVQAMFSVRLGKPARGLVECIRAAALGTPSVRPFVIGGLAVAHVAAKPFGRRGSVVVDRLEQGVRRLVKRPG